MGEKDEQGRDARPSQRAPLRPPGSQDEALDRELRELHEKYGQADEVPQRLVDLARRVADAYEQLETRAAGNRTHGT